MCSFLDEPFLQKKNVTMTQVTLALVIANFFVSVAILIQRWVGIYYHKVLIIARDCLKISLKFEWNIEYIHEEERIEGRTYSQAAYSYPIYS